MNTIIEKNAVIELHIKDIMIEKNYGIINLLPLFGELVLDTQKN